jgi:phosphate transport system permease protein
VTTIASRPGTDRHAPVARSRKVKNALATAAVIGSFAVAMVPLIWLTWTVVSKGWFAMTRNGWWTEDQRGISFRQGGGGMLHAMIGTAEQVVVCAVISVPIGIMVAIYLVEYADARGVRLTSFMVDILTGVPSIVAALFVYAVFVTTFGGQRAGILVSLALVMLMVPVIVRTTEEMLKLVPNELREASYALGVSKWRTIARVVLPTALSGITTGVMLGIARVAGETAPLLILVGYTRNTNTNLFDGYQGSLPGMIYDQTFNLGNTFGLDAQGNRVRLHFVADRMWGTALTLIVIVMALNLLARLVARTSKIAK